MMTVLEALGFAEVGIAVADFTTEGRVIQLGRPPNRIDLVTGISGVSFGEAWMSRVHATLDGIPVPLIGKEALLKNKRSAGRAKDLADIEAMGDQD